jgi:DNA polymerase (family 10)
MTKESSFTAAQGMLYYMTIKEVIEPYCERIEIAGSVRRGRQECHDLDIVLIPKEGCIDKIKSLCLSHHPMFAGAGIPDPKWGEKLASFSWDGFVQTDLYFCDKHTFPVIYLIRTGSKEHNIKLTTLAKNKGMFLAAEGTLYADRLKAAAIHVKDEMDVFYNLGLPYIEPGEREA